MSLAQPPPSTDLAQVDYTTARIAHWDRVARLARPQDWSQPYHRRLTRVYQSVVAPGQRVLEIGCAQGDLLAALRPSVGVGIDFSSEMVTRAARRHPGLHFLRGDAHQLDLRQTFDVVILSDVVNDLWDVEVAFKQLQHVIEPNSRVILNFYSRLWELPLDAARGLGLARPLLEQNWLTVDDVANLLRLADFEPTRHWDEILLPLDLPPLDDLANRYLARLWPMNQAALTHFVVARPAPSRQATRERAAGVGDRAGAQRGGQHRGHLRAHARDGPWHGARVCRGSFAGRHVRQHRTRDAQRIPSAAASSCGRRARARATRFGSAFRMPAVRC